MASLRVRVEKVSCAALSLGTALDSLSDYEPVAAPSDEEAAALRRLKEKLDKLDAIRGRLFPAPAVVGKAPVI